MQVAARAVRQAPLRARETVSGLPLALPLPLPEQVQVLAVQRQVQVLAVQPEAAVVVAVVLCPAQSVAHAPVRQPGLLWQRPVRGPVRGHPRLLALP